MKENSVKFNYEKSPTEDEKLKKSMVNKISEVFKPLDTYSSRNKYWAS